LTAHASQRYLEPNEKRTFLKGRFMETLNVSMPQELSDSVKRLVEQGRFPSASEYVQDLIRADLQRRAKDKVDELLREGMDSGEATPLDAGEWKAIRDEAAERSRQRKERPAHGAVHS
jgi:antitoxin ParD1/3/4